MSEAKAIRRNMMKLGFVTQLGGEGCQEEGQERRALCCRAVSRRYRCSWA